MKFNITGTTYGKDSELRDRSYSLSDIQDYFRSKTPSKSIKH